MLKKYINRMKRITEVLNYSQAEILRTLYVEPQEIDT